jgi:hypothetical protein
MEVASKLFPRQPDSAIKQTIQICKFFSRYNQLELVSYRKVAIGGRHPEV